MEWIKILGVFGLVISVACAVLLFIVRIRLKADGAQTPEQPVPVGVAKQAAVVATLDRAAQKLLAQNNFANLQEQVSAFEEMASRYRDEQEYGQALVWYEKILTIQKNLNEGELAVAETCFNMASLHFQNQAYDEAIACYEEARLLREQQLGLTNWDTLAVYRGLAEACAGKGAFDDAYDWYRRILTIEEESYGGGHEATQQTYRDLALLLLQKRDFGQALQWYEKLLALQDRLSENNPQQALLTCSDIADVYLTQGDTHKANQWLKKIVQERASAFEAQTGLGTVAVYQKLAESCAVLDSRPEEARAWYIKAQQTLEKTLDQKTDLSGYVANIVELCRTLGERALRKNDFETALKEHLIAYCFLLDYRGGKSPETGKQRILLEAVYQQSGHPGHFDPWLSKSLKAVPKDWL